MAKKKEIGDEILGGLSEFRDIVRGGSKIPAPLACTTVILNRAVMIYGVRQVREVRDMLQCRQVVNPRRIEPPFADNL